ncbi:hypothetical protein [Anaeroselena agilis]|uniref:Uncharacterized protein n=1 Tax=Anaeroselena agilis TaxID=3063788 RepID=A0ABU3NZ89_9FIRM|nr:hypothetical protein [Selenomonadales bacterium 4137-cl]
MGQDEFQHQVLQRLTAIETNGRYFKEGLEAIAQHSERITAVEASAKSAHRRIDGICAAAGLVGAAAGWVANFITSLWPKGGGH